MNQILTGAVFSRMIFSATAAVENQKQKINALNVFPVPDGDTGTNMGMTLSAAASALKKLTAPSLTKVADVTTSALLRGARGNSGVILSLLFRGFSNVFKGREEADGADFAQALTNGVEAAYKAVMKPAEGTILTVSRLSADAARSAAEENAEPDFVLSATIKAAQLALADTVNQNETLKKAGVVDAGGVGFVEILLGMQASLRGEDIVLSEAASETAKEEADFSEFATEEINFAFDTVFIVRKNSGVSFEPLCNYLATIGDSLVVGEDDTSFKVHVHTNIPGEALTEAQKYGTLELAKIENMRTQHDDLAAGRKVQSTDDLKEVEQELENQEPAPSKRYGVVAVCAGTGLANLFREIGADEMIEGGQTMNPSTEDILSAIEKTPAEIVFVLPNNKNIIMAAEAAKDLAKKQVLVLPSKTVPQGISALLSFNADQSPEENFAAMTAAMQAVSTMQITYAARNSDFDGFAIEAGDYLGLADGKLLRTAKDIEAVLTEMAQKINEEEREVVTIFYGSDLDENQAQAALEIFRKYAPDAEIDLISGGQPIYYYLISAE